MLSQGRHFVHTFIYLNLQYTHLYTLFFYRNTVCRPLTQAYKYCGENPHRLDHTGSLIAQHFVVADVLEVFEDI